MNRYLKYRNRQKADYLLSIGVFVLIFFGLVMIYSVSKYLSLQLTDGKNDKVFLSGQLVSLVVGIIAWVICQQIDYRFWQKWSGMMLVAVFVLLLSVFAFGHSGQSEAQRWINILGFQFQPSEPVKLAFIIYLAGWFASKKDDYREIDRNFWFFVVIVGAVSLFLLGQKDLGTLSVILGIAASIYFTAGAGLTRLGLAGILGAFVVWLAVRMEPYRMARITAFLDPENGTLSTSYHIRNALIAIGSGGLWGLGFGQSRQKYLYLPEAQTDSIFAITAEELGFARVAIIIIIYIFIIVRGFRIAKEAPDTFGRLMAVGIISWIAIQTFVNLGAMLALIPLTGVPLPFISFGGSNLVVMLAGVGILLNISKNGQRSL